MREPMTKKLILYGAGMVGGEIALYCAVRGIKIVYFCDADEKKQGSFHFGVPIRSIAETRSLLKQGGHCIFVSMLEDKASAVRQELTGAGIFGREDFYDDITDPLGLVPFRQSAVREVPERSALTRQAAESFVSLSKEKETELEEAISGVAPAYRNDHRFGRLEMYRGFIPWLQNLRTLKGARVLEIGCGTGASTVAFCEQGALVTAIDIGEYGIGVAKRRLEIYGLRADFRVMSATEIDELGGGFDFIIYSASMEHMTIPERLATIRQAYQMIGAGHYIVLLDTPNRMWYMDMHTSWLHYFDCLPEDLAIEYARYSPREDFKTAFCGRESWDDKVLKLARLGRGVSWHEFEAALYPFGDPKMLIVPENGSFRRFMGEGEPVYSRIQRGFAPPKVPGAFYEPGLNLALTKAEGNNDDSTDM